MYSVTISLEKKYLQSLRLTQPAAIVNNNHTITFNLQNTHTAIYESVTVNSDKSYIAVFVFL